MDCPLLESAPRDDPFAHALLEAEQPAPPEFVASVVEKLRLIRKEYPHKESTVDSCIRGLEGAPTLAKILVAAYVLNGGVSLKFHMNEDDGKDLDTLLSEIEGGLRDAWADT